MCYSKVGLSYGSNGVASDTGVLTPTSISADGGLSLTKNAMEYPNTSGITSIPNVSGTTTSTYASDVTVGNVSRQENEVTTTVSKYSDGSIGTLMIPNLRNLNVKIYEGETLDNMRKGVGQFAFTSQGDGNVGLAGHNSGSAGYFQGIWDLDYGSVIEYQTVKSPGVTQSSHINFTNSISLSVNRDICKHLLFLFMEIITIYTI